MALLGAILACSPQSPAPRAQTQPEPMLEELLRHEARLLEQNDDFPSDTGRFGSDPYAIVQVSGTGQVLLLLRNTSEVLLLDSALRLTDRKPAPRTPRGWVLVDGSYLWVTGELSNRIFLYRVQPGKLVLETEIVLQDSVGLRGIAYEPASASLFAIDALRRRLIQVRLAASWRNGDRAFHATEYEIGAGPIQIKYARGFLFLNLLLDHRLEAIPLTHATPDFLHKQSIEHRGPIWGFDVAQRGEHLLLALTGVEDHALDRTRGEFGYIDSFLFVYELPLSRPPGNAPLRRLAAWNLSEQNIITPKAVRFADGRRGSQLTVLAFGSDRGATLSLSGAALSLQTTFQIPPGITDFTIVQNTAGRQLLAANTLMDQVYRVNPEGGHVAQPLEHLTLHNQYPSGDARIGELLFFTTLLTPQNKTEGQLSRFTCETCHFEGTIDGRVHYTGRRTVFAATKTLKGLANNVPLFSRGGDRSLASMVLAEFRVANQDRHDDFSIETKHYPWLNGLGDVPRELGPLELRKSFLSFLVNFRHTPNAWLVTRGRLSPDAHDGLDVFRARCAYCHRAAPSTRTEEIVPVTEWQQLIENEAKDLVWGAPFYTKTNILPYVSAKGARVPSLRRVAEKYPYFTNGSSRDLEDVLLRFRYQGATAWHHYDGPGGADIKALSPDEVRQLAALLRYF